MADPDWGAMVLGGGDGGAYTLAHGANKNSILQLIRQFGDTSALSAPEAQAYNIQPTDLSGINDNPYSTVKNLLKTLHTNQYNITNNANAHGAEFSGAHQAQQLHEKDQGMQRNWDATQSLNSGILGVDSSDATSYGTAIQQLMNNYVAPVPAAAPAAPAVPAPAAAPAAPSLNGLGAPYVDPGARESLSQPAPNPTPKVTAAQTLVKQAARGFTGHA